jgi:hypothetical protein
MCIGVLDDHDSSLLQSTKMPLSFVVNHGAINVSRFKHRVL